MSDEWTTIRLHKGTAEQLQKIGRKDETYDDVIVRLMEEKLAREAKA